MKIASTMLVLLILFISVINTNTLAEAPKRNALAIMNIAFVKNNLQCSTALQKVIANTDTFKYAEFLTSQKKLPVPCPIDTTVILAKVATYKNVTDYEAINKILTDLKNVVMASGKKDEASLRCVEQLTTVVDQNGLFRAGLHYGKNFKNENDLKVTRPVQGNVLLLTPQILYLWPGNASSARYVMQPTEMYKVLAAQTFYPEVTTHCQEWKKAGVEAADYLKLTNKTHLLIDDGKGNKGWVDMDSVAFFDKSFDKALDEGIKKVYVNGYAWYLHGVWQGDDIDEPVDFEDPNSKQRFVSKGSIFHLNLLEFDEIHGSSGIENLNDKINYKNYFFVDVGMSSDASKMEFNLIKSLKVQSENGEISLVISCKSNNNIYSMTSPIVMLSNSLINFGDSNMKFKFNVFYRGK